MRILKWVGIGLVGLVVVLAGAVVYARSAARARLEQTFDIDVSPIPMPFPLTRAEVAALSPKAAPPAAAAAPGGSDATDSRPAPDGAETTVAEAAPKAPPTARTDLAKIAYQRAHERGRHYLESRAGCAECHGDDYGGKIIIDSPVMGQWIAPNITRGGTTRNYQSQDWVRLVRHGVKPNGRPAWMPCEDFTSFSDQEISDIALYIRSLPPVDRVMPESELGPVFSLLILKGDIPISAERIDHAATRPRYPPALAPNIELGKHLVATCTGCHGANLSGGPIAGGDPAWPPAANLTFHDSGLSGWSQADFAKAMKHGLRPDGGRIDPVMPIAYTSKLTRAEVEAIYLYLKTVPPQPKGTR